MKQNTETVLMMAAALAGALLVPPATAAENSFFYRGKASVIVPDPTPPAGDDQETPNPAIPTMSFATGNPTAAVRHRAWSFDAAALLRTENVPEGSEVAWSLTDAPAWVSMSPDGSLSGTPGAQDRTASARVSAAAAGVNASRVFQIVVGGAAWSVTGISAGRSHTCAVTTQGGVICWGANGNGALGDGSVAASSVPTEVIAPSGQTGFLRGVKEVHAGNSSTCALTTSNRVFCWGLNSSGQLGNGTTTGSVRPVPVLAVGSGQSVLTGVASLSVGANNGVCATLSNGYAACWGYNGNGQLGDKTTSNNSRPTYVQQPTSASAMPNLASISIGWWHACAVRVSGDTYCWGYGADGQIGNGAANHANPGPQRVVGINRSGVLSDVKAVAAGKGHTCALHGNGRAACWGDGSQGQLGDLGTRTTTFPVAVRAATDTSLVTANNDQISAGENFTCARFVNGYGICWGANGSGQLGVWDSTNRTFPHYVRSMGSSSNLLPGVTSVSAGQQHACVTYDNGKAACFGDGGSGRLGDGSGSSTNRARDVKFD